MFTIKHVLFVFGSITDQLPAFGGGTGAGFGVGDGLTVVDGVGVVGLVVVVGVVLGVVDFVVVVLGVVGFVVVDVMGVVGFVVVVDEVGIVTFVDGCGTIVGSGCGDGGKFIFPSLAVLSTKQKLQTRYLGSHIIYLSYQRQFN